MKKDTTWWDTVEWEMNRQMVQNQDGWMVLTAGGDIFANS